MISATCTQDGHLEIGCDDCGGAWDSRYDQIAKDYLANNPWYNVTAKGHTEGEIVVENNVDATCTTAGSYDNVVYCSVCKAELSRETITVDATGHRYSGLQVIQATCDTDGYIIIGCGDCDGEWNSKDGHQEALDYLASPVGQFITLGKAGHTEVIDEAVDATCTTVGKIEGSHCSACGVVITAQQEIPATGHRFSTVVTTPATCTVDGYVTITCGNCNEIYDSREDDEAKQYLIDNPYFNLGAKGHTEGEVVVENNVDATCTTAGSYDNVVYCSVCEVELSRETITVNATGHTINSFVITPATCTEDSYITVHCRLCEGEWNSKDGHQEALDYLEDTPYISLNKATGHTEVVDEAVEATCTTTGLTEGKHCSVCNTVLIKQEVVDALGHAIVEHAAQAPTCTAIGWDAYVTCSRCDYTTYAEKAALGHDYQAVVTAPTCEVKGYTTHTCTVCGDTYKDNETSALEHDLGEWVITTEATCIEAGVMTKSCSRCDYKETETTNKFLHDTTKHAAQEATCTAKGNVEYWYCSTCHKNYNAEQNGVEIDDITTSALGHKYESVVTDATCTTAGYTTHTCSVCSNSYNDSETAATGHTISSNIANKCTTCQVILTVDEIVNNAYALETGVTLTGRYQLTGVVTSISSNSVYISVSTVTESKTFQCYKLTGEGSSTLTIGDTITVEGVIKNYNGSIEFDGSASNGCVLVKSLHTITVADTENGTITIDKEGQVQYGQTVVITPNPVEGYEVDNVLVNDIVVTATEDIYSFVVTKAATVVVTFKTIGSAGEVLPTTVTVITYGTNGTKASDDSSISWTNNGVTIINNKSNSNTAIRTSDNDHFRAYKGSSISITAPGNIAKIVINCKSTDYLEPLLELEGATASEKIVTIILDGTSSTYNSTEFTGQVRFVSFEITYALACEHTGGTATCKEKAVCENCGQPYGELAAHTEVTVAGKAATCTETGLTDGIKCSVCDAIIKEQTTIALAEHNFVNGTCTVCNLSETTRFKVTFDTVENGAVSGLAAEADYASGETVTFMVKPNDGYIVKAVYANGTKCVAGDNDLYSFVITEDTTLTFEFEEATEYPDTPTKKFVKVTEAPTDWSGTYLIVYEEGSVAFNGGINSLDVAGNGFDVEIVDNTISFTSEIENYVFTIEKSETDYTIKSASGYYIGATKDSNSLVSNTTTKHTNTISINSDGTINIVGSGGAYLRFNAASNQNRFRYYKSSSYTNQKAITLYKLVEA